jgi:hypothetical protein
VAWLAPGLYFAAVLGGTALVRIGSMTWFGALVGLLVVLPVAWVLVSSLHPAKADRGCPRCGAEAVVRAAPDTTHGLRCCACGWQDDAASAWLLAEEEGPLELTVLAQRGRAIPGSTHVPMDSPPRRG